MPIYSLLLIRFESINKNPLDFLDSLIKLLVMYSVWRWAVYISGQSRVFFLLNSSLSFFLHLLMPHCLVLLLFIFIHILFLHFPFYFIIHKRRKFYRTISFKKKADSHVHYLCNLTFFLPTTRILKILKVPSHIPYFFVVHFLHVPPAIISVCLKMSSEYYSPSALCTVVAVISYYTCVPSSFNTKALWM